MVAPACNTSYSGGRHQKDRGLRPAHEIPSQPVKSWSGWPAPVIPATQRNTKRRVMVQASQGLK
jgi:hypothetical protein